MGRKDIVGTEGWQRVSGDRKRAVEWSRDMYQPVTNLRFVWVLFAARLNRLILALACLPSLDGAQRLRKHTRSNVLQTSESYISQGNGRHLP
jgi:hypothetical protein